jgi:hypothetical protein
LILIFSASDFVEFLIVAGNIENFGSVIALERQKCQSVGQLRDELVKYSMTGWRRQSSSRNFSKILRTRHEIFFPIITIYLHSSSFSISSAAE